MNDLVLLTALLRGPTYGYSLKSTAGMIFGGAAIHNNIVYPSLKKFMKNGWVQQSSVEGERGQQRKQYRITAAGRKYLFTQLAVFGDREASDAGAFLLRVALFDALPEKKRDVIVAARKAFLRARSEQLSELRRSTKPTSFPAIALDRVQAVVDDELLWLGQFEDQK